MPPVLCTMRTSPSETPLTVTLLRTTAFDRRAELAVGGEGVVDADVLPGGIGAGGVRIGLVEQVPLVDMAGAERRRIDLGPAQLHVHRRTRRVVGGDGAAGDA